MKISSRTAAWLLGLGGAVCLAIGSGCDDGTDPYSSGGNPSGPAAGGGSPHGGLILSLSEIKSTGFVATIGLATPSSDPGATAWNYAAVEDPQNQVFHKAAAFRPTGGAPGILTIAATKGRNNARMKLWRREGDSWKGELVWEGGFDGKDDKSQDRLRDFEIADVDHDGSDDVVVVTHDQGVVLLFRQQGGKLVPTEIDRNENMWIHEVEVGDVNNDGTVEFFATPSAPNTFTEGKEQPGMITMYRWDGSKFEKKVIDTLTERHAKEILCADPRGDGHPSLFAALEGDTDGKHPSTIVAYWFKDGDGDPVREELATFPGKLCRFLNCGDTDGDGIAEIIASTKADGIHAIAFKNGKWERTEVASGRLSGGFEHATVLSDWDGDGCQDLFVASDDQKKIRRFYWDPASKRYLMEDLLDRGKEKYLCWNIMPLPSDF